MQHSHKSIQKNPRSRVPKRSHRFGVGKEIGGAVYVHRTAEDVLPRAALSRAKEHCPADFEYHVVKYDYRRGIVSFVRSSDFDQSPEPSVEQVVTVYPDGRTVRRCYRDPPIYHHKWLFVRDDYDGFDVAESRTRSERIMALKGVDHSRIGKRQYWVDNVLPMLVGSGANSERAGREEL